MQRCALIEARFTVQIAFMMAAIMSQAEAL
jgi:hypothetical protein